MTLFYLLILAIVQGVTEFLPISSSGHLILLPNLLGVADQGLLLDVSVHVGTLGAVVIYFRRDLAEVAQGALRLISGKIDTRGAFLALCLIVATIPVMAAGLVLKLSGLSDLLRSMTVIGWTMLIFGLVLYWADQRGPMTKTAREWTLKEAVILGLWQVLALIPGTSRSGITITGARLLGYDRVEAARLSMLMSVPTILASGALLSLDLIGQPIGDALRDTAIAALFAFGAAYAALAVMMRMLRNISYTPFVIYRVILGLVLLVIAYGA